MYRPPKVRPKNVTIGRSDQFPSFFIPNNIKEDFKMANKNIVAHLEKSKTHIEKKQENIRQLKNKEHKILSLFF